MRKYYRIIDVPHSQLKACTGCVGYIEVDKAADWFSSISVKNESFKYIKGHASTERTYCACFYKSRRLVKEEISEVEATLEII